MLLRETLREYRASCEGLRDAARERSCVRSTDLETPSGVGSNGVERKGVDIDEKGWRLYAGASIRSTSVVPACDEAKGAGWRRL